VTSEVLREPPWRGEGRAESRRLPEVVGMEITEVRVSLRDDQPEKRLKAYATITFDQSFVVRNIKVIEGKTGLFVAMPSRKPKVACGSCGFKGDVGGRFCAQCGAPIAHASSVAEAEATEAMSHRDIAHPITAEFRQYLQRTILEAYDAERAKGRGSDAEAERT